MLKGSTRVAGGAPAANVLSHNWTAYILPYIDQAPLYNFWDWNLNVRSNGEVGYLTAPPDQVWVYAPKTELKAFYCPSRRDSMKANAEYAACDRVDIGYPPVVTGVWAHEAGGARLLVAIGIRQRYNGHARQAAHAALAGQYLLARVAVASEFPHHAGHLTEMDVVRQLQKIARRLERDLLLLGGLVGHQ